jgi:predicted nuclease with TOPRIM domain
MPQKAVKSGKRLFSVERGREFNVKERLEQRLIELKNEFESGQKMLAELGTKQATLRETLLRISGAIQVLEEELARFSEALPAPRRPQIPFGSREHLLQFVDPCKAE